MASYFDFLGTVWDFLPDEDKARMGELWQGYEQIFASAYQYFAEARLNVAIRDLVPFATERWLPYTFTDANQVLRPAIFTGNQDLSAPVNLSTHFLLKVGYNGMTPIELDLRGVIPAATTFTEIRNKINSTFGFAFASAVFQGSVLQLTSPTSGPTSTITIYPASIPANSAAEFVLGILDSSLPVTVPEFPYVYSLPYPNVADIPELRDFIRDASVTVTLFSGTDFVIESSGLIDFAEVPPAAMWAKRSLIDESTPWNNFGFLLNIFEPSSANYVAVLQGLWFAYWTGPTPANLTSALYLLFGLPVAPDVGMITAVTDTQITFQSASGAVAYFNIPSGLVSTVSQGDAVTRFQPLVSGITVIDKISLPNFISDQIGRAGIQRFLTQNATRGPGDTDETKALTMLNENCFLPQIDVNAFISPDINLGNVKTFLSGISPLEKTFLFQVIAGTFFEQLNFQDALAMDIALNITPNLDYNQTTFDEPSDLEDYETNDHPDLDMDSDNILFQETVEIVVTSFGNPLEDFFA